MLTASQAAERAARGAAFLDVQCPGWAAEIDVKRLDVRSPCQCVLGQLFPADGFGDAARAFWPLEGSQEFPDAAMISENGCGLADEDWVFGGDRDAAFALLTEAWRAEIATRMGVVS